MISYGFTFMNQPQSVEANDAWSGMIVDMIGHHVTLYNLYSFVLTQTFEDFD